MKINVNFLTMLFLINLNFSVFSALTAPCLRINKAKSATDFAISQSNNVILEGRLLLNSHELIKECIKNKNYNALQVIWDKIDASPLYRRPTKNQIAKYQQVIKKTFRNVKKQEECDQELHTYRNRLIRDLLLFSLSCTGSTALFIWGCKQIKYLEWLRDRSSSLKSSAFDQKQYLAKYAIDIAVFIGVPSVIALGIKFILDIIPPRDERSLQKIEKLVNHC